VALTRVQTGHARMIVVEARSFPGSWDTDHRYRAADIALAVALAESGLRLLANPSVPESMRLPHDGVGTDHSSVGLFQQQPQWWGGVQQCMSGPRSARAFLAALAKLSWPGHTNWALAQSVQRSAFSDGSNYQRWDATAIGLRKKLWK